MLTKHAVLIQVHSYPKLLEEIICNIEFENVYFFIHIDMKSSAFISKEIELFKIRHPNIRYMDKKIKVNHGGFSQIESTLHLLDLSYNDEDNEYDYFHLISGQDYPIVKEYEFNNFFDGNTKSYMQYDSDDEIEIWRKNKYLQRTQVIHFTDFFDFKFFSPKINYYLSRCATKAFRLLPYKRKVIHNLCGGWQWFSWHRKVVRYVLNQVELDPYYVRRFEMTYCCDELFFHTLLNDNCEELNIERYNSLRYIEWNPKRYTKYLPLVLDNREFIEIMASGAIFARKIHPITSRGLIKSINQKNKIGDSCHH